MADETLNIVNSTVVTPGQPIAKSTGELMMALYQARIKAIAEEAPDLGINIDDESKLLYFDLNNLNALLAALASGSQHVATCLGLGVLDDEGNPVEPTTDQLILMQELVDLQEAGNYAEYKEKLKEIRLAQTILIAGCGSDGQLNVQDTGVYSYYDNAGKCCPH